jgi:hypothetical protein
MIHLRLPPPHAVLLLLAGLIRGQLGLFLGVFNLIPKVSQYLPLCFSSTCGNSPHSVELLLFVIITSLEAWTSALTLHPVVARWSHLPVEDSPDFRGDRLSKLCVVRDNHNTTFECLQSI